MPVLFFEKFCIISVAVPNNGECQQEMASALQPCLQKGEVGISKEVCIMEVKDYTGWFIYWVTFLTGPALKVLSVGMAKSLPKK